MFLRYAIYRWFTMLLTLWVVSILVFVIINLPPGDFLSNQIAELRATGQAEGVAKSCLRRSVSPLGPGSESENFPRGCCNVWGWLRPSCMIPRS